MQKFRLKGTEDIYDVFPQMVELNFDGKYYLRYNIGIDGHNGFNNIMCIYDNKEFNEAYEEVKWSKAKQKWILASEYQFWIDDKE